MRIYASTRPLPLPVAKCHTERTPSLKRDVINEWPHTHTHARTQAHVYSNTAVNEYC